MAGLIPPSLGRSLPFAALLLAAAFGGLLCVLHGAQPLAVRGGALSPESFDARKGARYRVILRGRLDHQVRVSFQNGTGGLISRVAVVAAHDDGSDAPRWKQLKARASAPDARVVVEGDFSGRVELHLSDDRAAGRRWQASICFLGVLAWFCIVHWRQPAVQALALGTAYFLLLVPFETPADYSFATDGRYYVPTSLSLIYERNLDLDEFGGANPAEMFASDYRVRRGKDGRWFNLYPPGTSLLSLPLALIGDWLSDEVPDVSARARFIFGLAAKVLSAVTVGLFLLVARSLTQQRWAAWVLTLIFALATPQLGTHAGGLWSHNASVFCATLALGLWVWKEGRFSAWAAIPLALGVACRPTMILPACIFGLALLFQNRRSFVLFAGVSAVCALSFAWHSLSVWGSVVPPYYSGHAGASVNRLAAYLGTLVSPNRGLFVYCPVLLLSVWGGIAAWRQRGPQAIYPIAAAVTVAEWVIASRNENWWGGHSYGPRLLCELVPFAILLLIPAWGSIRRSATRKVFIVALSLASAWGLFVQVQALTNPNVYWWNMQPDIDLRPERLWDWKDWQILRRR